VPTSSHFTHWILSVKAKLPDHDFREDFPVPVTPQAPA